MIIKSIANIFRSKVRSMLTISGIAVGVFAVVIISAVGEMGTEQVSSTISHMGVDTLLIQPSSESVSVTLTDRDISTVRKIEGVDDVMPLMASVTEAKMINRRLDCYVWGVDKSADKLISLQAKHGRLITDADAAECARVCVIDEQFALKVYGRSNIVGKTLEMFLGGKYHRFEIVGIAQSGLSSLQGMLTNIMPGFMYIPISTMQHLCGRTTYDKIAVKLADMNEDSSVVSRITDKLDKENGFTDGYLCNNLLAQKGQLEDILSIVTTSLSMTAGISLAVAGISVMTTMMMSVSERKKEIGIKKAIGARSRDICKEFLAESIVMTLLGSVAGAVLGLAVSFVGSVIAAVPFSVNIAALAVCAGVCAGIGAAFGAYPAYRAAKLNPAEALRG